MVNKLKILRLVNELALGPRGPFRHIGVLIALQFLFVHFLISLILPAKQALLQPQRSARVAFASTAFLNAKELRCALLAGTSMSTCSLPEGVSGAGARDGCIGKGAKFKVSPTPAKWLKIKL